MKRNLVKKALEVIAVITLILEVFFLMIFATNPTMEAVCVMGIILCVYLLIDQFIRYLGRRCIRRYKQKMILHQVTVTDKIDTTRQREIEEY